MKKYTVICVVKSTVELMDKVFEKDLFEITQLIDSDVVVIDGCLPEFCGYHLEGRFAGYAVTSACAGDNRKDILERYTADQGADIWSHCEGVAGVPFVISAILSMIDRRAEVLSIEVFCEGE